MSQRVACRASSRAGVACKGNVVKGRDYCRWHDPSAEARARHQEESRRGGQAKAYGALPTTSALATLESLKGVDFTKADGVRQLLAAQLAQLAALPFDTRVAYAIAQTASIQRAAIEAFEPQGEPPPSKMTITHIVVHPEKKETV
ncbi:MAG TPA: hypothetical protein VGM82_01005 [Gemmatimonadaceae bacterium]|jgi:hypothetical protein